MINWDEIKNNIGELNGENILSPIDNKPLDNELIMCLFCNKINLKYRFEPYYEIPFIEYNTRIFKNSNETARLSFFNSSDQLVVTDPTA